MYTENIAFHRLYNLRTILGVRNRISTHRTAQEAHFFFTKWHFIQNVTLDFVLTCYKPPAHDAHVSKARYTHTTLS